MLHGRSAVNGGPVLLQDSCHSPMCAGTAAVAVCAAVTSSAAVVTSRSGLTPPLGPDDVTGPRPATKQSHRAAQHFEHENEEQQKLSYHAASPYLPCFSSLLERSSLWSGPYPNHVRAPRDGLPRESSRTFFCQSRSRRCRDWGCLLGGALSSSIWSSTSSHRPHSPAPCYPTWTQRPSHSQAHLCRLCFSRSRCTSAITSFCCPPTISSSIHSGAFQVPYSRDPHRSGCSLEWSTSTGTVTCNCYRSWRCWGDSAT